MKIRIIILVFVLLGSLNNHAQTKFAKSSVSNPTLYDGTMLNLKDGTKESIQFYSYTNAADLSTKYTIIVHGVEVYDVGFKYDKEKDSISIYLFDKEQIKSEPRFVKFRSIDSHVIIKDFQLNEEPKETDRCSILFSIDSARRFVTLHQFQAIGGVPVYFNLVELTSEVLNRHEKEVRDYKIWQEREETVARIRKEMLDYADKTIESVKQADSTMMRTEPTLTAEHPMQSLFEQKMNQLFKAYYASVNSFNDETFDVTFTFKCNGFGKINVDTVRSIFFNNGIPQKNWFKDSFIVNIKPEIEKETYPTLQKTFVLPLKNDFNNKFKVDSLKQREANTFDNEIQKVYTLFNSYVSRTLNIPTKYSYQFKYKCKTRLASWRVTGSAPNFKFKDPSDQKREGSDDLKKIFIEKIYNPAYKKYDIKISEVWINGTMVSQDIQLISKK